MARLESVAVGGYWPTPPHLVERIASLFSRGSGDASVVDPCCGDGAAVRAFTKAVPTTHARPGTCHTLTCEMERTRADLARNVLYGSVLVGDAFQVTWTRDDGAGLLFLNPPYDQDGQYGRLEERFLDRFTNVLADDGLLCFIVPATSLEASARTLATHYADLACYRFPDPDFEDFKQVVLVGRRRIPAFDVRTHDRIVAWARGGRDLPVLPDRSENPLPIRTRPYGSGVDRWALAPLDLQGLLSKARPWTHRGRVVQDVVPASLDDIMLRTYPVATPPRPAHIAAGIAAGIFNGSRVEPDDPEGPLPSLLVKGCFDREFRTVEEKVNKDGEVTGFVQVQQPRLRVTVLDMDSHRYVTLPDEGPARPTRVDDMSIAGLLGQYGQSLMACMERQCPIGFDPRRDQGGPLPSSPRRLYRAQQNAVHALVKLLGGPDATIQQRRGKAAILLGEIGSGKSSCALQTARACGAERVLVMCPPHLLTSWVNEVAATAPDWTAVVLDGPEAIDQVANKTNVVGLLSRETAKLGYGLVAVQGQCPRCGHPVPEGDLVKKRARCQHRERFAVDEVGRVGMALARYLIEIKPDTIYASTLDGRLDRLRRERPARQPYRHGIDVVTAVTELVTRGVELPRLLRILIGLNDRSVTIAALRAQVQHTTTWDDPAGYISLLLDPKCRETEQILVETRNRAASYNVSTWDRIIHNRVRSATEQVTFQRDQRITWKDGYCAINDASIDRIENFESAVAAICAEGQFRSGRTCDEPLYQAVPEPRRVPLATYIQKRHARTFDFLILDECHEVTSEHAAQSKAASRLQRLGMATLRMTGTIMNGYADSLFTTMWETSRVFRAEFPFDSRPRFIDRYGYRKQFVEATDADKKVVTIEYGAVSDRQIQKGRTIGSAPGVLPLFLLRHLLPCSVTLHKSDLAIDLPACTQEIVRVEPMPEQDRKFRTVKTALVEAMKRDLFVPERTGRLVGQLAELPSYLDRMTHDTGNTPDGTYEVRYPESLDSELVWSETPIRSTDPMPKEAAMLDRVEAELAEGRNVMVFGWHVSLLPRLARLIEERIGEKVPILYADKVSTGKRQDWIDREIVKKKKRVMVCNPVAIQTGLNNLVHFCTEIWFENPACNPNTFRQAVGRIDRIGQVKPTRVVTFVYAGSLQVNLQDLLANKVAVATATDGLDPESALRAAGVGDDTYMAALSVGKHLWRLLNDET